MSKMAVPLRDRARRLRFGGTVAALCVVLVDPLAASALAVAAPPASARVTTVEANGPDRQRVLVAVPGAGAGLSPTSVELTTDGTTRAATVRAQPIPVSLALVPLAANSADGEAALAAATDVVLELNPVGQISVAVGAPPHVASSPTSDLGGLLRTLGSPGSFATGDFRGVLTAASRSLPAGPRAVVVVLPAASAATLPDVDPLPALRPNPGDFPVPLYVMTSGALPPGVERAVSASGGRVFRTPIANLSAGAAALDQDLSHWFAVSYLSAVPPRQLTVSVTSDGRRLTSSWTAPPVEAEALPRNHQPAFLRLGLAGLLVALAISLWVGWHRRRSRFPLVQEDARGVAERPAPYIFTEQPAATPVGIDRRQSSDSAVAGSTAAPPALPEAPTGQEPPATPTAAWEPPPVPFARSGVEPPVHLREAADQPPVGSGPDPIPRSGSAAQPELPGTHEQSPSVPTPPEVFELPRPDLPRSADARPGRNDRPVSS
jgi:hypothetical protein